jgi:transcriptional regulator with XRE-family HTH domain
MKVKEADPSDLLRRLARAVARRRGLESLTQEDVAYEAGIALRTYQNLESGRLNPRYLTLVAVARALHVKLGDFLNEIR